MAKTYELKLKVRDYECDAQGIVNNANYLHYFEATRHELMEQEGVVFKDLTEANIIPVVRSANIQYKTSLKGSDLFLCSVDIDRKGLRYFFKQKITRIADKAVCAIATIEIVCLTDGKIGMPQLFDDAFADYITWLD